MTHGNWLRTLFTCARSNVDLTILAWKSNTTLKLDIPIFGHTGLAFVYRSDTVPNLRFIARLTHGHFVGIHYDARLFRLLETHSNNMLIKRLADFKTFRSEPLPGLTSLLDILSRKSYQEKLEN